MAHEILFVTSFSADLYWASARHLIASFKLVSQPGQLLCCYEGYRPTAATASDPHTILLDCLDEDKLLHEWLSDNKDVIPVHLGGTYPECRCPGRELRHTVHQKGCLNGWMNRNASRWFRKVVALVHGADYARHHRIPWLVWLDADTYFIEPLPTKALVRWCKPNAFMFHFRGHREATESGIMGFDLAPERQGGGAAFIEKLHRRYVSKGYRKYERFDDGYQIGKLIEEGAVKANDMVTMFPAATKWPCKPNDVMPNTEIRRYLLHAKGRNGQYLNLMA